MILMAVKARTILVKDGESVLQENTMVVIARVYVGQKMGNALIMGVTGKTGSVPLVNSRVVSATRKDGIAQIFLVHYTTFSNAYIC